MELDCGNLNLSSEEASYVINTFILNSNNFTLLRQTSFENNLLTRIPPEIRLFPRLTQLNFGHNLIESISATDFKFPLSNEDDDNQQMLQIVLHLNYIRHIEPGAFEGKFIAWYRSFINDIEIDYKNKNRRLFRPRFSDDLLKQ